MYFSVSPTILSSRDEPQGHHHPHHDREHCDEHPWPARSGTCMTASSGFYIRAWDWKMVSVQAPQALITLRSTYAAPSYHQLHITEMGAIWGSKRLTPESYAYLHRAGLVVESLDSKPSFSDSLPLHHPAFHTDFIRMLGGSRKQARKRIPSSHQASMPPGVFWGSAGKATLTQGSVLPSLAHSAV